MPGFAIGALSESRGSAFSSSVQAMPSLDVRCGTSMWPGHLLNEFGSMCRTPSASMTAPGLMYRSFVPASFVSTTTSSPNVNLWVTAGAGVGLTREVGPGLPAAAGVPGAEGLAVPQPAATSATMGTTTDSDRSLRNVASGSAGHRYP